MTDCLAGPAHRDNDGRHRGGCLTADPTTGQPPDTRRRGSMSIWLFVGGMIAFALGVYTGWLLRNMRRYPTPRAIGWWFTFEEGEGICFRDDGRGCRLWYLGEESYERAHSEADSA